MSTLKTYRLALLGLAVLPILAIAPSAVASAQGTGTGHVATHHAYTVYEQPDSKATAGYAFSPAKLTVRVGDTVTWKDKTATPHNIVGVGTTTIHRPAINSASYTLTFTKAGTYHYICQVHPGMAGVITVTK